MQFSTKPQKQSKASALFFDIGEMAATLPPQPRFLPRLKALGGVTKPLAAGDPFNPDRKVKPRFNVKNHVHQTITVFIGRPTFEERSPNSLAVCEYHHTVPTYFVLPALEGSEDCHHLKLLNDSALPFGRHRIDGSLCNLGPEERQLLP